jgi:rare lipoprotein A
MRLRFSWKMIQVLNVAAFLTAAAVLTSCAGREMPAAHPVPTPPPAAPSAEPPSAPSVLPAPAAEPVSREVYRETGTASWYGREFHGRKTASGEIFDMNGISAAHRTLPLGTAIRVTNLENHKVITVRVNDRGPFARNRVIDLSYGAAKDLGFVAQGTVSVEIETLEPVQDKGQYTVQAAVFAEAENARVLKDRLSTKFEVISILPYESNIGKFFRVQVGAYASKEKAELIAGKLVLEGLEPIVMRKD